MIDLPPGFVLHRAAYPLDFTQLEGAIPWQQRTIQLYGRDVEVPRLTAWMGEASYVYSGILHPPTATPDVVSRLRVALEDRLGARFNSVLANLYRSGSDSVAWHADDEDELGEEPTIASVSIGAPRRFLVKRRDPENRRARRSWSIVLAHGDLLVMSGRSQEDYLHSVPKTSRAVGAARQPDVPVDRGEVTGRDRATWHDLSIMQARYQLCLF